MPEPPTSRQFTHSVRGSGPVAAMTVTGLIGGFEGPRTAADLPLVIALHGGTYTSAYFDIPGYSLLGRAAAVGVPIIALDRPGYKGSSPAPESESIILTNAEMLDQVVGEIWEERGEGLRGIPPGRCSGWRPRAASWRCQATPARPGRRSPKCP